MCRNTHPVRGGNIPKLVQILDNSVLLNYVFAEGLSSGLNGVSEQAMFGMGSAGDSQARKAHQIGQLGQSGSLGRARERTVPGRNVVSGNLRLVSVVFFR